MDLFVVPTIGFDLLYAFVIVRLDRRDLVWINVTTHPTAEWVARQITEAFPWDGAPRYPRPAIGSTAPLSRADCVPWESETSPLSLGTARRCHQFKRHPGRTSSPLSSDLGFSVHTSSDRVDQGKAHQSQDG
jgi:hypothetical protein